MAMKCSQCGTRLVPGTRSCANCGQQFAMEVPPDPVPVQAAAAPPPQAPYGQPPAYGQQVPPQVPPYGQQAPQYGQNPMGGPTPGPAGPQDPIKKYGPWAAVAAVLIGGYWYTSHKPTPPAPTPPPVVQPNQPAPPTDPNQPNTPVVQPVVQPTGGTPDSKDTIIANIKQVISLLTQFHDLNGPGKIQEDNPTWVTDMQQNAQQMKAAADQGSALVWPDAYAQAQAAYRQACANFSYVGEKWPQAVAAKDDNAAQDCSAHLTAAINAMNQTQDAINAVEGNGGGQSQNSLGSSAKLTPMSSDLKLAPKK